MIRLLLLFDENYDNYDKMSFSKVVYTTMILMIAKVLKKDTGKLFLQVYN